LLSALLSHAPRYQHCRLPCLFPLIAACVHRKENLFCKTIPPKAQKTPYFDYREYPDAFYFEKKAANDAICNYANVHYA